MHCKQPCPRFEFVLLLSRRFATENLVEIQLIRFDRIEDCYFFPQKILMKYLSYFICEVYAPVAREDLRK